MSLAKTSEKPLAHHISACHEVPIGTTPLVFSAPRVHTVVSNTCSASPTSPALRWAQNVDSVVRFHGFSAEARCKTAMRSKRSRSTMLGCKLATCLSADTEASMLHPVAGWGRSSTARSTIHPCTTEAWAVSGAPWACQPATNSSRCA